MEIRRCQHIKTNGQQCGSPAVRGLNSCYFHGTWGHTYHLTINDARYDASPATFNLPVLEDYESVQMAIMQVLQKLTTGHLDRKTAGLLLYGLQIASSNLRYAHFDPRAETVVIDPTATHLTPLDGDQWSDQDESDEDYDGEEEDDDDDGEGDGENLDEEDLNQELGDDAELEEQEPVGADAPIRGPQAERGATQPAADTSQQETRKEEQPRISDAQFFQALANLCDHRENGTPLKFPVYPARPPKPCGAGALDRDEKQEKCGADIPVGEKRPPAAVGSGTHDNGNKTSGGG